MSDGITAWTPRNADDLVGKSVGTATSTSAATDGEWWGEVRCSNCRWVSARHTSPERAWDEWVGHALRAHPLEESKYVKTTGENDSYGAP